MLVSIITITFNSEKHLEQTIQSVLGQDYPDIEYIIVDGGSTDCTLDIIRKYEGRLAKWISEPDNGIADAMNKGIRMASGDIIGIIHSDDYYEPGAVSAVVRAFEENAEVELVHGDMRLMRNNAEMMVKPPLDTENAAWKQMPVLHPTVFVKKHIYEAYGMFDTSYKIAMDYDLILRFLANGARFCYLDRVISAMRGEGTSEADFSATWRETRDIAIKYGYSKLKVYGYFMFRTAEKKAGKLLRRRGLRGIAKLYRMVFYPGVPEDF